MDQPWQDQWLNAMSAVKPNVVVLLAGRWEVVDREYKGKWTNILQPTFAAYVKSQLEAASTLVTTTGANLVFLTAPCTDEGEQPDGQPWPEDNPARLAEYNKLLYQVAALHPKTDSVVDLDAAVCPERQVHHHHRRGGGPAQRRRPLHRRRWGRGGQGHHAGHRGGGTGPDGGERHDHHHHDDAAGVEVVSRRVRPGSGSRSAG